MNLDEPKSDHDQGHHGHDHHNHDPHDHHNHDDRAPHHGGGGSHFGHFHAHRHGPSSAANLKLALFLNLSFSILEIIGGLWSGSVAVLSNAVHDLGDAAAVAIAYFMERRATKAASHRYSYGYKRLSLLSALITCAFLVTTAALVLAKAVPLLAHPVRPRLDGMAAFAVVGIAVNAFAAFRLARGGTLNERVVSWHMIEDVLGWAIVLLGSGIMAIVDLPILDPLLCVIMSLFILWGVLRNLRGTLRLFLQAAPDSIDLVSLRREIAGIEMVMGTHDAHLWSLDGESHVLTLHVVVAPTLSLPHIQALKQQIRRLVEAKGRIHLTVEIETTAEECAGDCAKEL